jgi:hypothetical protein
MLSNVAAVPVMVPLLLRPRVPASLTMEELEEAGYGKIEEADVPENATLLYVTAVVPEPP